MGKREVNIEILSQNIDDKELVKHSKLIMTPKYQMAAITSRGISSLNKENQDSALMVNHPESEDLVMLVLADGLSSSANGQNASRIITEDLSEWFTMPKMSKTYIDNPMVMESILYSKLRHLNIKLYKNDAQASFVMAIIGRNDTMIAHNGNCRCYSINNGIHLHTKDDLQWYKYNDDELISADEVKFLVGKDYLDKTIGTYDPKNGYAYPQIDIVSNDQYKSLLLTTHGVTDTLDSGDLETCIRNYDAVTALETIMDLSINSNSRKISPELIQRFKNQGLSSMLMREIMPGQSNASAVLYKKRRNS